MPIRINLMAEAQAAEEARRRNPVKLGIWIAGFCVALVGLWIAKVQMDIYFAKMDLNSLNAQWKAAEEKYNSVTNEEARIAVIQGKIAALDHLQTNRFLWGPVLNALQQTVVDPIQVTHIWGLQTYEAEPNKSIGAGATMKTIPGMANFEKVKLFIAGKDYSPAAEGYKKYEDTLNHYDFFAKIMGGRDGFTIDGAPGPKFPDAPGSAREFRVFTLTNQLPDIRRSDK
ncbi:MAG: hypothetical protein ABSG78_18915 [Verrucomicrobiota bacterium]